MVRNREETSLEADEEKQATVKALYEQTDYYYELDKMLDLSSSFQRYRIRKVMEMYLPSESDTVLDLGCGWGSFTLALAPHVKSITGIDYSSKAIAMCEGRSRAEGHGNVHLICAEADKTGLPSEQFDAIICADLVEHLYPVVFSRTVEECHRLLKPGGRLVIWTPHRGHLFEILKNHNILLKAEPTHVDYKTMKGICSELEDASFFIRKAYYVESHIPILSVIEHTLMGRVPILRRRIAVLAEKRRARR